MIMKTINVRLIASTIYVATMIGGLLLLASIAGCSTTDAVDAYAREHNILGEVVCSTYFPDVSPEDAHERGCPSDGVDFNKGDIQNEIKGQVEEAPAL